MIMMLMMRITCGQVKKRMNEMTVLKHRKWQMVELVLRDIEKRAIMIGMAQRSSVLDWFPKWIVYPEGCDERLQPSTPRSNQSCRSKRDKVSSKAKNLEGWEGVLFRGMEKPLPSKLRGKR